MGPNMIDAKPNPQSPSLAWVVIAGLWFWLVSWVAFWMIALPFSGNKSITVGSMLSFLPWSAAPLLVGMLAWWLGFHRRRPLLAQWRLRWLSCRAYSLASLHLWVSVTGHPDSTCIRACRVHSGNRVFGDASLLVSTSYRIGLRATCVPSSRDSRLLIREGRGPTPGSSGPAPAGFARLRGPLNRNVRRHRKRDRVQRRLRHLLERLRDGSGDDFVQRSAVTTP